MKRLITFSLFLIVLVSLVAGTSFAADVVVAGFSFKTAASPAAGNDVTDLADGWWTFLLSGGTSLTATTDVATLTSNFNDTTKIWKYEIYDGTSWTMIGSLVDGYNTIINNTTVQGTPPLLASAGPMYAEKMRISYDCTLTGANAFASGTGGITATAVPEPSSLIALATGAVGILGLIKRRRS